MSGGEEYFIGGRREPVYGPIVMAGFGGIFIELFRDRAIRIAPVTPNEADDMLRQLKTYPILEGIRGRGPLDIDALKELICRVSHLICTVEEIDEIDLNPVMVRPKGEGVSVVDSRVFFRN
jgi:acetyltransferase